MKSIRKGFAVALAAAFIALTVCSDAYAAGKNDNKTALKKQNELLRSELDSLKAELERYRMELRRTDSLANEIIDFYQETKPAGDTCVVEYTAEVSDSLLNLWYMHRLVSEENLDYMDIDSVKFQSNVPDSVYIERIAKMNSIITLPYNDIVKDYLDLTEGLLDGSITGEYKETGFRKGDVAAKGAAELWYQCDA